MCQPIHFFEQRPAPAILQIAPRQMVPCNMTLERAWRWCVVASIRELRVARAGRRDIAWPNLRRLFTRRWADTCTLYDIAADAPERKELCELGLALLQQAVSRRQRRAA